LHFADFCRNRAAPETPHLAVLAGEGFQELQVRLVDLGGVSIFVSFG